MKYYTKDWYARMLHLSHCGSQETLNRQHPEIAAPANAYRTYTEQNNLSAIDGQLNFHNWRVLLAQRKGDDFCLFLGCDENTASVLLRCVNTRLIGQELAQVEEAEYRWLYHEIYLTAAGYELRLLLAAGHDLCEWSIQCAHMELTEVKE